MRPSGRSLKRRLGGKKVAPEVEAGPEEAPEEEGNARAEEEEGEREGTTGISLERRFGGGALAASSGRFSARRGVLSYANCGGRTSAFGFYVFSGARARLLKVQTKTEKSFGKEDPTRPKDIHPPREPREDVPPEALNLVSTMRGVVRPCRPPSQIQECGISRNRCELLWVLFIQLAAFPSASVARFGVPRGPAMVFVGSMILGMLIPIACRVCISIFKSFLMVMPILIVLAFAAYLFMPSQQAVPASNLMIRWS